MNHNDPLDSPKIYAIRPNKTALKKQHVKIQNLAKDLIKKTPLAVAKLQLNDNLVQQIELASRIKGGALKRQVKHIANLLLSLDDDILESLIANKIPLQQTNSLQTQPVKSNKNMIATATAQQLIQQGDDYLQQLMQHHTNLDRQVLRNLMLQARREKQLGKTTKNQQKLITYLTQNTEQ